MGELDGISLAKEINRLAPACRVIFLSSYAGYLMDAYEAEHIYYVLKSDEAARLPVALRKRWARSRPRSAHAPARRQLSARRARHGAVS